MSWIAAATGALGSLVDFYTSKRAADRNENLQYDLANNGIAMKVADAQRAGIHPLYALGAPAFNASPVAVGTNVAPSLSEMGQNIDRAIHATRTDTERQEKLASLQLEREGLENDLLRARIAEITHAPNPPLPSNSNYSGLLDGQGNSSPTGSGYVVENPTQKTHEQKNRPGQDAGYINDYSYVRTSRGGYAIVPSNDVKQRIEDSVIPEAMWSIRNMLLPQMSGKGLPAPDPKFYRLPEGFDYWKWNPVYQEFEPAKSPVRNYDRKKDKYIRG